MTMIDHSRRAARIVYDLPDQPLPVAPSRPSLFGVDVNEVLALAATLTAAGYDAGPVPKRAASIWDAVSAAAANPARHLDAALIDLDPADVVERLHRVAAELATVGQHEQRAEQSVNRQLAASTIEAMRGDADRLIVQMRAEFDPAVKVVETAAAAGLLPTTDAALLAETGTPEQIAAYRKLGPAVATLDRLAALRNQITEVLQVGPVDPFMVAFLAEASSLLHLEGARRIWVGETEVVQHDMPLVGSHLARVRRQRLGGAWLALAVGSYKLRLNTGREAQSVLDAAEQAD